MAHDLLFTNETEWYAQDLRALFDLFGEGVMRDDDLAVTAGATGLSVDVAAGSALIASDEAGDQGKYRVVSELPVNSADFISGGLDPADATDPRIDRIVARVYDDEIDGSGLTAYRLEVVTGTPTAGATLINNNGIAAVPPSSIVLARVLVPAGASSVTAPNVADDRVVVSTGGGGGTGILASTIDAVGDLLVGDAADSVDRLPVGADGDVLTADSGAPLGVGWTPPAAVLPSKANFPFSTTGALASGATEDIDLDLFGFASIRAVALSADEECRIRIYATDTHRTADAARAIGTDPPDNSGLYLELVTGVGLTVHYLSPQVDMSDLTSWTPATPTLWIALTNLAASAYDFSIDLYAIPTEA